MITSVHIHNFRSIADSGNLTLGPVTLLVGRNNSGKSSLLRALYLMQQGSQFDVDDVRLRSVDIQVRCAVAPGSALARQTHPDPTVQQRPDLHIDVTASREEPTPSFQATWGDAASSQLQLPSARPNHVIVPVFARRRADMYDATVRQDLANTVGLSDRYLASRIAALTGDHPEAQRFRGLLERVVGLRIGNHLTSQGQLPGRSLSAHEHISLARMGDGIGAVMAVVSELASQTPRVFLIEEPETDLHPDALQNLLNVIVEGVAEGSQFIVSTHSDLVLRQLGSVEGAALYKTRQDEVEGLPTTSFELVQDAFGRVEALRDLGYDARIPPAWIVFEESSAEQFVRDALIPLFYPRLAAVQTVSARGAGNLKVTVQDLTRLLLFVHLQGQQAADRTWVLADGDEGGLKGLAAVRDSYATLHPDHLVSLHPSGFEAYYPIVFQSEVAAALAIEDKRVRRETKGTLASKVTSWALANPEQAKPALERSATKLLEVLATIDASLASG